MNEYKQQSVEKKVKLIKPGATPQEFVHTKTPVPQARDVSLRLPLRA
jgi:hypothetical protein